MAATVLNGTTSGGSISWTNNTGGNVRLIINYFGTAGQAATSTTYGIQIAIGSAIFRSNYAAAIGKNLSYFTAGASGANSYIVTQLNMDISRIGGDPSQFFTTIPIELYIPSSTTLTLSRITGSGEYSYNLLLLPEAG